MDGSSPCLTLRRKRQRRTELTDGEEWSVACAPPGATSRVIIVLSIDAPRAGTTPPRLIGSWQIEITFLRSPQVTRPLRVEAAAVT